MITVYLLHFDRPYPRGKHPQHYLGVAADFDQRMREHRSGSSKGRLTRALYHAGIGFTVVRTWEFKVAYAAFNKERELKKQRNHARFCPTCQYAKVM